MEPFQFLPPSEIFTKSRLYKQDKGMHTSPVSRDRKSQEASLRQDVSSSNAALTGLFDEDRYMGIAMLSSEVIEELRDQEGSC